MQPLYDALRDVLQKLSGYIEKGTIKLPMAFMRGRTLDDAFILDKPKHHHNQMKMFLTRMVKTPNL